MSDIEEFQERLNESGIFNTEISKAHNSLYVWVPSGGYGIPREWREGLDVVFTESIGMDSLRESHRLYRENEHHVIIFSGAED